MLQVKVAAVKTYLQGTPGQLAFCAVDMASREAKCQAIQAETGAVFIPPYNHRHIMAGQVATCCCCFNQAVQFTLFQRLLGVSKELLGSAPPGILLLSLGCCC